MTTVIETEIKEFPLLSRGKVRDIYDIDEKSLLIVTSDRISAFDVVMPTPIEQKGVVLNQITLFWMKMMEDIVDNHIITPSVSQYPKGLQPYAKTLEGRSVLAKKATPLPIECIVRGYITGSGLAEYKKTGTMSGHILPSGLQESDKLPTPLFTPSTKAELGAHDENITLNKAAELVGEKMLAQVEKISLAIYSRAQEYAKQRGIIIADTKFEFGLIDGQLTLIDEVLTPDSSRFWPHESYVSGQSQPSFDKQFLRDWLINSGFNKQPPAPVIPEAIGRQTRAKYMEAYSILTGQALEV